MDLLIGDTVKYAIKFIIVIKKKKKKKNLKKCQIAKNVLIRNAKKN